MKAGRLIEQTISDFKSAGIDSARLDTLLLLEAATKRDRSFLVAHEEFIIDKKQLQQFKALAKKRLQREPLAYVLGYKEFYGLDFKVDSNVLIPRVETEKLVEHIIYSTKQGASILDMGTGSGAIAVSIKKHRPDFDVTASDISASALDIAQTNAARLGTKIKFIESDLFDNIKNRFDVIAANLPYVASGKDVAEEVKREPAGALFSGIDGLDIYKAFMKNVGDHLKPGSEIVIECEKHQSEKLAPSRGQLSSLSDLVHLIKLP